MGDSLAECFWLGVSYKIADKISTRIGVILRLDCTSPEGCLIVLRKWQMAMLRLISAKEQGGDCSGFYKIVAVTFATFFSSLNKSLSLVHIQDWLHNFLKLVQKVCSKLMNFKTANSKALNQAQGSSKLETLTTRVALLNVYQMRTS